MWWKKNRITGIHRAFRTKNGRKMAAFPRKNESKMALLKRKQALANMLPYLSCFSCLSCFSS